ncbi:MAG: glycosyltransferase family 2 protein [Candidatus Omnitrophica bacterium]|nr:glycosyltransferase family 2 protein [Candidatus Omnitrophota bacterium]
MIIIVLPAYNEKREIPILLKRIDGFMKTNRLDYKVIAVNDGSTDGTRKVIDDLANLYPLTKVHFEKNLGVGSVVRTGLKLAMEMSTDDEDVIVTMDADNTHDPKIIKMILRKIEEGYEVVVPSYFCSGGMLIGLPFRKYFFSRVANFLYQVLFPVKGLRSYTGFYKGYKAGALKLAMEKFKDKLVESQGFAAMAELLIKLRRTPLFIAEVPMILRYDYKGEKSKLKVLPTIKEHLRVISKNLFTRDIMT